MKTKGFTLVELLVVIAILAILATVSVVGYTSFIDRAEQSNNETEAHQIQTMIESALIGKDYVTVTVDGALVYITEDGVESTYTVGTNKGTDLTTDIGDLGANLALVDGALVYSTDDTKTTDDITLVKKAD